MTQLYRWRHSINRFSSRLSDVTTLGIRPADLVLDLGSGGDPHPRANVLCDKFIADDCERACEESLTVDRPLVLADATRTPFADRAFDFVFCAHLLEHMNEPHLLLNELQRIGRRGYIETPSKVYEKLWGWDFHKWLVTKDGDRLILEAKDRIVFDDDLHKWFSTHIERKSMWNFFMPRLRELELLTILTWDEEIVYEVRGQVRTNQEHFTQAEMDWERTLAEIGSLGAAPVSKTRQVKSAIGKWARRRSDERVPEILRHLICPQCRGTLENESERWHCARCHLLYPIANGVPVMLGEAAQPSATDAGPALGGQRDRLPADRQGEINR